MSPRKRAARPVSAEARGRAAGYRSGLEDDISAALKAAGVPFEYETSTIHYTVPERKARYKPDWKLLNNDIIVESKGRFVTADRTKHRLIREQYPDLDIRFVFSNPNAKIGKKSSTTYALWCERLGIKYAAKSIPQEWINEPKTRKRTAALKAATTPPKR